MKAPREYRCGERLANTGRICGKTFTRRWNLARHIKLVHQSDGGGGTTFVYLTASSFSGDDARGTQARDREVQFATGAQDVPGERRRAYHDASRGQDRTLYTQPLPSYNIKRSSTFPRQQKAVSWLTEAAKDALDNRVAELMGSWGLRPSHSGTCILVPSDWAHVPPLILMERFSYEKCPKIDDPHMVSRAVEHAWPPCPR